MLDYEISDIPERYRGNWIAIVYLSATDHTPMVKCAIGPTKKDPEKSDAEGETFIRLFQGVNYDFCQKIQKLITNMRSSQLGDLTLSHILSSKS